MSEVWHTVLTPDAPCWVAFEADHCVLLPDPGHDPAQKAKKRLLQSASEGEIAEHALGYLFITADVFTLVRHSEVENHHQVREVALRKRQNRKVSHVQLPVPVERLSDLILREASKDKVEVIALEPTAQGGEVRFLREGSWLTVMTPPPGVIPKLIQHWRPKGLNLTQGPWGEGAILTV
ncbi:MAG: hypothetical protein KF760_28410 [Candidatus Eremiobacteraeota bacterium]|nr:hypothetical protein [Candidatus Eremiobacteraeota bacterium]MCW5865820.1 hypothetical protein [Candidatus Eremiobacteraeota bacterium]